LFLPLFFPFFYISYAGLRLEHCQWIEHYFIYNGAHDSPRSPSPTGISSTDSSSSEEAARFNGIVRIRRRARVRVHLSPIHNLGVFGSVDFNCPSASLDQDLQHLTFFRSNQSIFRAVI